MAVTDSKLGFKFEYRLSGGPPTTAEFIFQDTETITKGDLVSVQSGLADLAATNDTNIAGVALQTVVGTTAVSKIEIIVDEDAVYSTYDANARTAGTTLDIAGATGQMTLATSSNIDVIVVQNSSATERTFVRISPPEHLLHL